MDPMPEQHNTRDDQTDPTGIPGTGPAPGPGSDSVVFSAAPAPAPDPAPAAPEQTGWPWFLPQDGLRHEDLDSAVDLEQDPAEAAAVYARIPLVRGAVALLEHIGEGSPLGPDGGLGAADVRALVGAVGIELDADPGTDFLADPSSDRGAEEPAAMGEAAELVGPWNALVGGGWLTVDDVEVTPGEGMVPAAAQDEDPEAFVRFARALIVLLVLDGLRRGPDEGGLFGGPDTFTALLHTVGPEGLLLPATIRIALDRGLVPADPGGDPDMDEIHRYWQAERDLTALAAYGLLDRETSPDGQDVRVRGTVEVLVEAYGALEMLEELDGPR
jgi:hypothetical protein